MKVIVTYGKYAAFLGSLDVRICIKVSICIAG